MTWLDKNLEDGCKVGITIGKQSYLISATFYSESDPSEIVEIGVKMCVHVRDYREMVYITKTTAGVWVAEKHLRDDDVRIVFVDGIEDEPLTKKERTIKGLGLL